MNSRTILVVQKTIIYNSFVVRNYVKWSLRGKNVTLRMYHLFTLIISSFHQKVLNSLQIFTRRVAQHYNASINKNTQKSIWSCCQKCSNLPFRRFMKAVKMQIFNWNTVMRWVNMILLLQTTIYYIPYLFPL